MAEEQKYCEKCGRLKRIGDFYQTSRLDRFPDGHFNFCKPCLTMHVNNWEPDTFKPILEDADVPYIEDEWNGLLQKYAKDPKKVTGTTILGRYLSKMKLSQYKNYKWEDTERLETEAHAKRIKSLEERGYDQDAIDEKLAEVAKPQKPIGYKTDAEKEADEYAAIAAQYNTTEVFPEQTQEPDEFEDELTDEDKIYLKLKWGKEYKPTEWVQLEQLYEDMMASYDIQGAGQKDTLKLICKASLTAHQCINMKDIEGFQKATRTYDLLMKSAKLTAAQAAESSGQAIDCIGQLVERCERETGFIPEFYVEQPNDKIDKILLDYERYVKTLITEETNLNMLIEKAVREIQEEEVRIQKAGEEATDDDLLFLEDIDTPSLTLKDYDEFQKIKHNDDEDEEDDY